jgi:23S rRNA (cytidine1920-2'-O)/16S rRNA (cytidine1409-2'-O)-methyltransferase
MSAETPNRSSEIPRKQRLDLLLVERGLVESREQARRLIMAGEVSVDGVVADKAGIQVKTEAALEVREALPYVSRGGLKLAAALNDFALDVAGMVAVDIGASTGGFSDVLLQRGARRVYAIDVGYGQLAWKLRTDPRVVSMERTNIRYLDSLPEGVLADLAVIDASFIGLGLVLPATMRLLTPAAQIVALIKPQFEAGRRQVGKGGVVRDPAVHQAVIESVVAEAQSLSLHVAGLTLSPAPGPAGNIEFLVWLSRHAGTSLDLDRVIATLLARAAGLGRGR